MKSFCTVKGIVEKVKRQAKERPEESIYKYISNKKLSRILKELLTLKSKKTNSPVFQNVQKC